LVGDQGAYAKDLTYLTDLLLKVPVVQFAAQYHNLKDLHELVEAALSARYVYLLQLLSNKVILINLLF
jgi:hypothetical protein